MEVLAAGWIGSLGRLVGGGKLSFLDVVLCGLADQETFHTHILLFLAAFSLTDSPHLISYCHMDRTGWHFQHIYMVHFNPKPYLRGENVLFLFF